MHKELPDVAAVDGVLRVAGEIDAVSAPCVDAALAAGEAVAIDLSAVTFMDSSGLNLLLAHDRPLVEHGGVRRVVAMSRPVERVLEVTGLLRTLTADSTQLVRGPPLLEVPMGASQGDGAVDSGTADRAPPAASAGSSPIGWP
jgi:anti-anti-sigma factor